MRFADARNIASIITSCSMIISLTGGAWVWITNTSTPRTLSMART